MSRESVHIYMNTTDKIIMHRSRGASLGFAGSIADCGKDTFNGVGRTNVLPVFGREVVERQQYVPILGQFLTARSYFTPYVSTNKSKAALASSFVLVIHISFSPALAFSCIGLGIAPVTLAIL